MAKADVTAEKILGAIVRQQFKRYLNTEAQEEMARMSDEELGEVIVHCAQGIQQVLAFVEGLDWVALIRRAQEEGG